MTFCEHRLDGDPNGLRCKREEHSDHPNGHSYTGSSVQDAHTASEDAAESSRG